MIRSACAAFVLVACTCALGTSAAPLSSPDVRWVAWASRYQLWLAREQPLDRVQWPSTRASFNSKNAGYFNDPDLVAAGLLLFDQVHTIPEQLDLGIRHIELEVHFAFDQMRLCRGGGDIAAMCKEATDRTGLSVCEDIINVRLIDLAHTGCKRSDSEFGDVLRAVSAWLAKAENAREVVWISIKDASDGREAAIDELLQTHFGSMLLTPAEKASQWGNQWPSWQQAVDSGLRVLVDMDSPTPSTSASVWFRPLPSPALASPAPVSAFVESACSRRPVSGSGAAIDMAYGNGAAFVSFYAGRRVFDLCLAATAKNLHRQRVCGANFVPQYTITDDDGIMSAAAVVALQHCGFTVTHGSVSAERLMDTIWSWELGTGFTSMKQGAIMPAIGQGRWFQARLDLPDPHVFACLSDDPSVAPQAEWRITQEPGGVWEEGAAACPTGYSFQPPTTRESNERLLLALRRSAAGSVWIGAHTKAISDDDGALREEDATDWLQIAMYGGIGLGAVLVVTFMIMGALWYRNRLQDQAEEARHRTE